MGTKYRSEISKKNKYWISKHRFLEISHHCMQYNEWKDEYRKLEDQLLPKGVDYDGMPHGTDTSNPTESIGARMAELKTKIETVEQVAKETDPEIAEYILKAVTNEDITFNYLKQFMGIPCERDMYYDRRRKFYWLMSKIKV